METSLMVYELLGIIIAIIIAIIILFIYACCVISGRCDKK